MNQRDKVAWLSNPPAILLTIVLMAWYSMALGASASGKILRAQGFVAAATPQGDIRTLKVGSPIYTGEVISTGPNSLVQMNFTDGSKVTLRSDSRFQIEKYAFSENKSDDNSFFRLLKGGLRTISGLIGKRSKDKYKVTTAVATIGIRGTDYELRLCQSDCQNVDPIPENGLYIGVISVDSVVTVTNNTGTVDLTAGDYALVGGVDAKPKLSFFRFPALGMNPLICQ